MLWIPGKPLPKERPRTVTLPNGAKRTYTPARTLAYERSVATAWQQAHLGEGPVDGPVHVLMVFDTDGVHVNVVQLDVPKPKIRADIDNLAKAVLDGLQGVAFLDDRQVVSISAEKA